MSEIRIRNDVLDTSDPCAVAERLRSIRLTIVAGGQAERVRFGEEEVEYSRANLTLLEREIAKFEDACILKNGGRVKRRRYARRIRFG
ncbi:hypothetical protein C8N35_11531 [Breoghania corrubedonensis]|uniref:GpW protein n=1 Tax=Breoghania corrubedonensis TaxID=665038 RepID=A0A2T5UR57_9HYPH|nr:hypothetical protein [Breoghania corrubedonensis]PTW53911.1 hypothetical protein C8N35_11531 [Breoghania corrubedonensis]